MLKRELQNTTPIDASELFTPTRLNQLTQHMEEVLFDSGKGDLNRTQYILASFIARPVVQRTLALMTELPTDTDQYDVKKGAIALRMVQRAKVILDSLTTPGTRQQQDHQYFESIVTSMTPPDASWSRIIGMLVELLGIDRHAVERAQTRGKRFDDDAEGPVGAFRRCMGEGEAEAAQGCTRRCASRVHQILAQHYETGHKREE